MDLGTFARLADGLSVWLGVIADPAENAYAHSPLGPRRRSPLPLEEMTDDERGQYLHLSVTGLFTEVGEVAELVGWKPWSSSVGWTAEPDRIADEVADVLRFLANICRVAGVSGARLAEALKRGLEDGHNRVGNGYEQRRRG